MTKRVQLREDCTCHGATPTGGGVPVVKNVKVLGLESRNRRRYLPEAVNSALSLYEGKVVNLDHPADGAGTPRSVRDRFGRLTNVRVDNSGVWADLSYNPKHPFAEAFAWCVANDPSAVGLSHNAVGSGRQDGGEFLVEKIHEVRSVDLVADPATTKSLFESMDYDNDPLMGGMGDDAMQAEETPGHEDHLVDAVGALLKDSDISPEAKKKKILAIMKILHDEGGMVEEPMGDDADAKDEGDSGDEDDGEKKEKKDEEESLEDLPVEAQNKRLREQLDTFKAREARAKRVEYVKGLANSAGLAKELVTSVFLEQLADANSDRKIRELIDDRRLASAVRKPVSAGKGYKKPITDQEFKEQLTGA
jgi:hypothetical protein